MYCRQGVHHVYCSSRTAAALTPVYTRLQLLPLSFQNFALRHISSACTISLPLVFLPLLTMM